MKKSIGMFGGCFNPPTNAHIKLAKRVIKEFDLEKVIFVPVGNYYKKHDLVDELHRYNMLKIICDKEENLEVTDIELNSIEHLYAIDIFRILKNTYKDYNIYYIIGSDNLKNINNWRSSFELIRNFKYIVLDRGEDSSDLIIANNMELSKSKHNFYVLRVEERMNCSSTEIRKRIQEKRDVCDIIDEDIYEYIVQNNLYIKE